MREEEIFNSIESYTNEYIKRHAALIDFIINIPRFSLDKKNYMILELTMLKETCGNILEKSGELGKFIIDDLCKKK